MSSIYARGGKLWCRLKGAKKAGVWSSHPTRFSVGQEAEALRYVETAQETIDERRVRGAAPGMPVPVRTYAAKWIDQRRALDLDWKNDEGRLKHHVLPVIGDMTMGKVRAPDIVDLFRQIRSSTTRRVAQRTVYNIYSVVAAMFRDAKLDDVIGQSPCELDSRQLGPLTDKDPEWRSGAVFSRAEVEHIISSSLVPADRRLVYALELLAGVRPGEAAALRWRHYDHEVAPLGRLLVAVAYNTRKHRQKSTKTATSKHVPVHPTLAAMLDDWKDSGWEAMMGRAPGPDDLIVPLPPAAAIRRRSRKGEAFRGHDYSGKRWREDDLPVLELGRHRRHYDMRATFITLALEDGADPHIIETRVTHTKKSRSAFDGYNRGRQWEITCCEVAKLNVTRPLATVLLQAEASGEEQTGKSVEAAGVEGGQATVSGCVNHATWEKDMTDANHQELSRTLSVANLATALAAAVLAGDQLAARRLATEIRDIAPDRVRSAAPTRARRT